MQGKLIQVDSLSIYLWDLLISHAQFVQTSKDHFVSLYYAMWGFDKASRSLRMKGKNIVLCTLESTHKDTTRAPKLSASRNGSWDKAIQKPSSKLTYKMRNKILTAKLP